MQHEATPTEIKQLQLSRELEITWSDGEVSRIKDNDLRQACRCTDCRWTPDRSGRTIHADDVRIMKIIPVGNYAVQFCFDDEHDRGIYPWKLLRELGSKS